MAYLEEVLLNNLISHYRQYLNLQDAIFLKVEHEEAFVAPVYKISLPDNKQFILKICKRQNDYLCEAYFLKFFANKIPVPDIINLIEPTADIPGAILMEHLKGNLLIKSELTKSLACTIGSLLAKIHTHKVGGYGDLTKPHQLNTDPTSYFTFKFEESIMECKDHLSKKLLDKSCDYFNSSTNLLISADGPCITHRDFRPGNILVSEGEIQGIIDWSSARGSFVEEDLFSLELGDWSNNINIKNAFLKGYASVRPVPDYLKMMPLLLLSKAIATIGFTVKTKTWDNKNKDLYQRHLRLLEKILKEH